jgi:glycosyltransferase involved in cell wall biosynthesis
VKVLHVIPSLAARTGGPAVTAVEFARQASRNGIEVMIFATDAAHPARAGSGRAAAREELVEGADSVPTRLFPLRKPYRLARSPSLRDAVRAELPNYDVLHLHSLYLYPQLAAAKEARKCGIPYVVTPHGTLDPWMRRRGRIRKWIVDVTAQKRMLAGAAVLHFTLEEEARLAADIAGNRPRVVLPNGVHWAELGQLPEPGHFRSARLDGHEGPVVLFLGRLAQKKGLDLLVQAFALAVRRHPDALLVIAGPDEENLRVPLVSLAERHGIGDRVVFTGLLRGEEKRAALSAADVWVLPSHTEAFTIALIEALAAGVATLISPAVNLAGEIEWAGAGIVSETRPEVFGGALSYLLEADARRAEYAKRGREFARRFDWEALAPRIVELYEKVTRWAYH